MNSRLLQEAVHRFRQARVLVIGDVIVDHFIWGSVSRISPEAPVPVVNVTREEMLLGGSANVLRNIISLGGQGAICGLVGQDEMGDRLVDLLKELAVSDAGLVRGRRPTTVKTRIVAQGQQVVRFDRETTGTPSRDSIARMEAFLEQHLENYDAVVVSDYAKGVINEQLMSSLRLLVERIRKRQHRPLPLIVDPKPAHIHHFVGATVITPNHLEACRISGMTIEDEQSLRAAARHIQEDIGCRAVLVTRGEAGMAILQEDGDFVTIPTMAKEVYDVTGAGDTVAATLALGLAVGCSFVEAATLANHAAGIVVAKIGTASVGHGELLATLDSEGQE